METDRALPSEPREAETAKLLLKSLGCSTWPADWGESELADEVVGGSAQMNLGVLGPKSFGGQVGKDESRIGTVGKTDRARSLHAEGEAAIDSIDSVGAGKAVGKCREHEDARHESDGCRLGLEAFVQTSRRPQIHDWTPNSVSHS